MLATLEQRHTAQHRGAEHTRPGAPWPDEDSRDHSIGLEEVLAMRVGCWRPPVYVTVPTAAVLSANQQQCSVPWSAPWS